MLTGSIFMNDVEYPGISPQTIQSMMVTMLNLTYPIGSYYETTDTTFNPNNEWIGTWVLEDEGLVHVSSGSNYAVTENAQDGGEKEHTLTGDESGIQEHNTTSSGALSGGITGGSHTHYSGIYNGWNPVVSSNGGTHGYLIAANQSSTQYKTSATTHSHDLPNHTHSISGANAKNAHNNMQPYKIVNRWHRTA